MRPCSPGAPMAWRRPIPRDDWVRTVAVERSSYGRRAWLVRSVIVRVAGRVVSTRVALGRTAKPFDYGQPRPIAIYGILMKVS